MSLSLSLSPSLSLPPLPLPPSRHPSLLLLFVFFVHSPRGQRKWKRILRGPFRISKVGVI